MYTEGVDEFNEAENRPPRTYVSTGGNQDSLKLQRENERLKKSLEKEQFFNRLLDQELKELKAAQENSAGYKMESNGSNGVSKGTFNLVLVIALALAVFAIYTTFFNNKPSQFSQTVGTASPAAGVAAPATVKDSVPNIVSSRRSTLPAVSKREQQQIASTVVPERNVTIPERTVPVKESKNNKPKAAPIEQPVTSNNAPVQATQPVATTPAPAPPVAAERSVVGQYMVSSKANFYSAPDGNTLRSYFISPGSDKVVNALEDKNGFIYVEFKNDVGYVTKGWLSKADLTKQ